MKKFDFRNEELSILKKLDSPEKIQDFLDNELSYNLEENGITYYSPRLVLRKKMADCFEGAVFAAACLAIHGKKPLLIDLRALKHDDDHLVAVYKVGKNWGAIGKSKFTGLKYREPIFPSIKSLALSYFEHFYDWNALKTLREYSIPLNLLKFGSDWMISEKPIEFVATEIDKVKHYFIVSKNLEKTLRKVDSVMFKAEITVLSKNSKYLKYLKKNCKEAKNIEF